MGGGGESLIGPAAAFDAVLALYTSDALLLDTIGGSEAAKRTPLWEAHAETFFDWGPKEINLGGLDGFLAELEAFLVPTV